LNGILGVLWFKMKFYMYMMFVLVKYFFIFVTYQNNKSDKILGKQKWYQNNKSDIILCKQKW